MAALSGFSKVLLGESLVAGLLRYRQGELRLTQMSFDVPFPFLSEMLRTHLESPHS